VLRRDAHVSEISELLDLPQSSTSVLLRSMVSIGYLSYNRETRAFRPTTKVAVLGSWVNGPLLSEGALMRLVDRINVGTGQSVVIAVRNQIWAQYIHVAQARAQERIFLVKGANRPLSRGAAGLSAMRSGGRSKSNSETRIANRANASNVVIPGLVPGIQGSRKYQRVDTRHNGSPEQVRR
jgi:DNA-binding IclR family transcriptional regulator